MSLIINNVKKSFHKNPVLKNVSYTIQKGSLLALIGQNGAGKSTLIKCILNFLKLDGGEIRFQGKSVMQWMEEGKVGYMPEILHGMEMIEIGEYMEDLMTLRGLTKKEYEDRWNELIELFCLKEHLTKTFQECSKGTVKKVMFLQAILHKPELLILDEPTDGLDPISRKRMLCEVDRMKKEGTTILLTTHILSDIVMVADEVAVLQKGEMIAGCALKDLTGSLEDWYCDIILQSGGLGEI